MKPCPVCKADAAKPRVGSLGESKGVWCTQCGHSTNTVAEWDNRPTAVYNAVRDVPYSDAWGLGRYLSPSFGKPYADPNASRGPDGGAPAILEALSGAVLDNLASKVFGISRRDVMPVGLSDDESFREYLRRLYEVTKP